MKRNKYFYVKDETSFSSTRPPQLVRFDPNCYLELDENVDHRQYLIVQLDKLREGKMEAPVSTTYDKVKPIIKEVFESHYALVIKYIKDEAIDDGEFYILRESSSWYKISYYSKNEKTKRNIVIDFRDSINHLLLFIENTPGHKYRPTFRKKAIAISQEEFLQFVNLTLQYLYDPESLLVLVSGYIENFYNLVKGETKFEPLLVSNGNVPETVIDQLEARKDSLEKRLIEIDSDGPIERGKLRGEIEGIKFAIKTIKMNFCY